MPTWLQIPVSIEETAERHVRPALREVFVDLCRLPGSDGTWMVVRGGMGTVTRVLADTARRAGAEIIVSDEVAHIETRGSIVTGVSTTQGEFQRARAVLVNADPFRMLSMLGDGCPQDLRERIDRYRRPGTSIKVNLCLRDLPTFSCLPDRIGQHRATIHLLPEHDTRAKLREAFAECTEGRLPSHPSVEWYIHTTLDPSLQDEQGRHSSALFCQWVPHTLSESSWEMEESRFVGRLLDICDRFAPGTSALVDDIFTLTPPKIESHFGITAGHIHHVDNSFGFADRLPYRLPVAGLYACGAGCHPAGSVVGAAGHNAANAVLRDLAISS